MEAGVRLEIEGRLYRRFKDEVLDKMNSDESITRAQIMYQLNISDYLTDRLLYYIKKNCDDNGFNSNVVNTHEGFRIQFMKPKMITKMYIIKL